MCPPSSRPVGLLHDGGRGRAKREPRLLELIRACDNGDVAPSAALVGLEDERRRAGQPAAVEIIVSRLQLAEKVEHPW